YGRVVGFSVTRSGHLFGTSTCVRSNPGFETATHFVPLEGIKASPFASVTCGPVFVDGGIASTSAPATGLPAGSVTFTISRGEQPSDIKIAKTIGRRSSRINEGR